jgi:hypothetical protein
MITGEELLLRYLLIPKSIFLREMFATLLCQPFPLFWQTSACSNDIGLAQLVVKIETKVCTYKL